MCMNNACLLVLSYYMKESVDFCTQGVPNANWELVPWGVTYLRITTAASTARVNKSHSIFHIFILLLKRDIISPFIFASVLKHGI